MSYLILQIVLFLTAAALLGVAFGWIMARRDLDARIQEERESRSSTIADWQSRHQEAVDLADAARTRISSLESDLDILRGELYAKSERMVQLESRIEGGATDPRGLEAGLLARRAGEIEGLRDALDAAHEQLRRVRAALSDKDGIVAQLQKRLAERDQQIAQLDREAQPRDVHAPSEHAAAPQPARLTNTGDEASTTPNLSHEPQMASEPPPILSSPPPRDDLRKIKGIGLKLERMLNGVGVHQYRQIASWTSDDIEAIQAKLEGFPQRIRRDNWVEAAKAEHRKKYGEEL